MEPLIVFYGYLSLAFGWLYYLVVFLSLGIAIYTYYQSRDLYKTAERYLKSLLYLGIVDLTISGVYATVMTFKCLLQKF